jgi:hypothetical protein
VSDNAKKVDRRKNKPLYPPPEAVLPFILDRTRYGRIAKHFGCSRRVIKNRAKQLRERGYEFVSWRREPEIDGIKRCVRCRLEKPVAEYYRKSDKRSSSWCKQCVRLGRKMRVYGLTEEEINHLPISEMCPLCEQRYSESLIPVIDHDHETGKVRGIICFLCNHALGRISDNSATATRMAQYLREHGR